MANTALATTIETYLDIINDKLSAIANHAWRTIAVDNLVLSGATAPSTVTVSSTSMPVTGASRITVLMDITGATTGVVVSVRGGLSGFGYFLLRSVTASAGLHAFKIGDLTTGAGADVNSLSRVNDIFIEMSLAANTGAGTGVTTTLRTRFLTEG